jgi:hypothetical protein
VGNVQDPQATSTSAYQDFRIREEALNFAAIQMKKRYGTQHLPQHFNVGDYIYLNPHSGYEIPQTKGPRKKAGP